MLIIFLLIAPSTCQFASYLSLRLRLPGRCREGDFDCGFGHCIPVKNFHDGRADCMDGSDEWCLFGQIRCGAYCVDFKDGLGCIFNSKCDGSSKQPKFCDQSKEKVCRESQAFPCKGYGECVLWQNLMDGQSDCIDGSDEDAEYVRTLEGPFRCYFNRTRQPQPQVSIKYPPYFFLTPPPLVSTLPLCTRCPSPVVFPPILPIQPTAQPPQSFPTLIPSKEAESNQPILPVAGLSTIPPVHISHITPVSATQAEPDYGNFFTESSYPTPYPTKIAFTVEAHIKTILPVTISTTSPTSQPSHGEQTIAKGWTTDAFAHIKVIPDAGKHSGGQEATHIDLGTGEIVYGGPTSTLRPITTVEMRVTTEIPTQPPSHSTAPNGPADGIFFPLPVHPVTNRPAAIRPVPPYIFRTLRPIIPQQTTPSEGVTDYGPPEHLIPIRPGIAVPTAFPDGRATTPKYPFPSDEDYEGEIYGRTGPTVKIGVVTTEGSVLSSSSPSNVPTTEGSHSTRISFSSTTTEIISTEASQASSFEPTQSPESTSSIAFVNVVPEEGEKTKNSSCPDALLESLKERYPSPYCRCESANNTECQYTNKTLVRVGSETICDDNSAATDEDKARIILSTIKNSLPFSTCIDHGRDDGIVVSMNCPGCSLQQIQSAVDKYNSGPIQVHFEALNTSICSYSSLNNCHRYANCVVDSSGLRFHCVCKNGTTDVSGGKGTDCFGFPSDNDCIMILRVCLIFWLFLLLGLLFCCPLVYWMYYQLADKQRRSTAVHPVQTVQVKPKPASKASSPQIEPKISTTSTRSAMASVLVDALRNNAKGISAVSHSMTTKEKVRFTDEVTYPPSAADWRPLPDPNMEPPPGIIRTPGMTPSASETRLNETASTPQAPSPVQSLAGTPAAETPILDQVRNPDSFRGTPLIERTSVHSLPILSIDVPQTHKTSLDMNQIQSPRQSGTSSPTPIVVTADVHQENQAQDNHSLVSVGVQPTIWETYRAVGVIGADRGREDSSSSLDDLIGRKFPESRPASKASRIEDKSIEIPVPKLDLIPTAPEALSSAEKKSPRASHEAEKKVDSAKETTAFPPAQIARKKSSTSLKLAEMLGVTLDDQNDMQALTDMATEKIDLPLEPISIPAEHLQKLEQDLMTLDQDNKKRISDSQALEDAVLKELQEEEKRKEDLKHLMPEQKEDINKPPFVPEAARKMAGGRRPFANFLAVPRRGEQTSSTEESESEMSFQKRMEAIRRGGKEANPFKDRKRRYRKPERQLSSISEKSAEIASDAAIMEPSSGDFTVSAPNTTRSLSDWHAFIPKHRRFDGSTTDDTDADIPSRFRRTQIIGSPEIPDVTKRRSRERLDMLESARARNLKKAAHQSNHVPSKQQLNSASKAAPTKKSFLPQISRKSTANSRASLDSKGRASIVSRKIASRKTEMRSSKSASDLTVEQQEIRTRGGLVSRREKIARSEEFLSKAQRPPWDYSPYRDGDEKTLPPIHHRSTYSLRSVHVSPASVKRRTTSHSPLHTTRSGSSVSLSRYFDPREPNKPPKEELWWTPHD